MKYRILAIFALVIIGIFAYKESSIVDIDEEATKAWASVYIAKTGNTEAIEELRSTLEIQDYQVVANTALRAAEKIKNPSSTKYNALPYSKDIYRIILIDSDLDKGNLSKLSAYESRIDILKSKTEKTKLYTKLARIAYNNGDINRYNILLEKAFNSSANLPALISRTNLADIVKLTVDCDDVENFYKYAPKIPESYQKNTALFDMIKSPKIMKELKLKEKDVDYKKNAKFKYLPNGHFEYINQYSKQMEAGNYSTIKRRYIYLYFPFLPYAWQLERSADINFPIFAYHAYLYKRQEMYDLFKEASLSDEQKDNARKIYTTYIDYCAFILLKMGETQEAVSLIKSIEIDHKRNNTLRKLIRLILQDPNGYSLLKKEGLI